MNALNYYDVDSLISKTIITEKKFNVQDSNFHYENKFKLSKEDNDQIKRQFLIKDQHCKQIYNGISKIVEIFWNNKKFLIEDKICMIDEDLKQNQFMMNSKYDKQRGESTVLSNQSEKYNGQSSSSGDKYRHQNLYLIKRRGDKNDQKGDQKGRKNVVKNFAKAFANYLKQHNLHDNLSDIIKQYQKMIENYKYNNHLILQTIRHNKIGELFQKFLQNKAQFWIQHSKITDKDLHSEAIHDYLNLYDGNGMEQSTSQKSEFSIYNSS